MIYRSLVQNNMRGLFIVFEGCDRVGKTTQLNLLVDALRARGRSVETLRFPMRDTLTGKLLDQYLTSDCSLPAEALHLLFAANRAEFKHVIEETLERGIDLVVDRYSLSGVAYSAANGADINWAESVEATLPKPDVMIYLHCDDTSTLTTREGFGDERYETPEFQSRVKSIMSEMALDRYARHLISINVDHRSKQQVHNEIISTPFVIGWDLIPVRCENLFLFNRIFQ